MATNPQPVASPLSAEELQQCLEDPRRAKTIRGPAFIACLECGLQFRQLGNHLRQEHGLTAPQYRAKPCATGLPRYNPGTALIAESLHQELSEFRKQPRFVEHLETVRYPVHKMIESRPSRRGQITQEYRLNKGESQRGGRSDLQKVPDSAIARLRLQGLTNEEIAVHFGLRSRSTVRTRLAKMGLPGRQSRFAHAQSVTGRTILDLCEDFDLTKRDLVKVLKNEQESRRRDTDGSKRGPLPKWIAESIYRQSIRSRVDAPLGIEVADSLLGLRKKWIEAFCKGGGRRGKQVRDFLKSEIRDLPQLRAWLKGSLAELRNEHPADVLGWTCEQARQEVAHTNDDGSSGRRFRTLMFFWSELEKFTAEKPNLLSQRLVDDLVDELLAGDYGATPYRIRCAADNKLTPLDPRTLRQRILEELGRTVENTAERRPRGRQFTARHEVFIKADQLYADLKAKDPKSSWGKVARILVPDEYKKDPRGAADRLRLGVDHLSKRRTKPHQR